MNYYSTSRLLVGHQGDVEVEGGAIVGTEGLNSMATEQMHVAPLDCSTTLYIYIGHEQKDVHPVGYIPQEKETLYVSEQENSYCSAVSSHYNICTLTILSSSYAAYSSVRPYYPVGIKSPGFTSTGHD